MNLIRRIQFAIVAFIRSRDGSTPAHPRRDGSYGWPLRAADPGYGPVALRIFASGKGLHGSDERTERQEGSDDE